MYPLLTSNIRDSCSKGSRSSVMTSMLLHSLSNNKISVCNVISCLFVLGVAGHLLVLRRDGFS